MKSKLIVARCAFTMVTVAMAFTAPVHAQPQQDRQLKQVEPVSAWPGSAKRWALVIGVDQYQDAQIGHLNGADHDAHSLAYALVRYAGFPEDQVILLATDQPGERQPTRVNILRRLYNLASAAPKDGLLLVSFAGHGMERGGQAYLLPADAQIADDIAFLEDTAISVGRMKERIKATGVGQVVVLLDACRNAPGGRTDADNPLTAAYTRAFDFDVRNREVQAFVTFYATAVGQRAYEYSEKQQGYFTWAVVEGLKGEAANERGEVTLAQLVKFVQATVPRRIAIDIGPVKQKPFAIIEGYKADELIIAVTSPRTAKPPQEEIAQDDNDAWSIGVWEGTAYQKNTNETWTIRLTISQSTYGIDYPSLSCGGRLTLIDRRPGMIKFREKITYGHCVDNGELLIQRLSASQAAFRYSEPGSKVIDSSATLDKVR